MVVCISPPNTHTHNGKGPYCSTSSTYNCISCSLRTVSLQQTNKQNHKTTTQKEKKRYKKPQVRLRCERKEKEKKSKKKETKKKVCSRLCHNCFISMLSQTDSKSQQYNLLRGKTRTRLQKKKEVRRNTVTFLPNHLSSPPPSSYSHHLPRSFQYSMPSNRQRKLQLLETEVTDQPKNLTPPK
ncbi:hypothetical protein BDD12DRAFT_833188 [Trichophaea hybrida]|nr:hypothetical protein BDD12DRAFT_833188 [Trichophaea hybrida]